ncbi:hypothetical protein AB0E01_20745 [Nocardia vinacea]|uniref:hypothetical protein n=1 Tax=Nocardia vinacea TaxID=96468 RepID=UPI0033EA90ED
MSSATPSRTTVGQSSKPLAARGCELEMWYRDIHGCLFHPLPRAKQTRFTGRVLLGHTPIG